MRDTGHDSVPPMAVATDSESPIDTPPADCTLRGATQARCSPPREVGATADASAALASPSGSARSTYTCSPQRSVKRSPSAHPVC